MTLMLRTLLAATVIPRGAAAQGPTTPTSPPRDLDAYVARVMRDFEVPGLAIAVVQDGRVLLGLIVEQSPQTVTLVDAKNDKTVIERSKIESLEPSGVSLMPEKLLDELTNDQVRDLFAYLQADGPRPK